MTESKSMARAKSLKWIGPVKGNGTPRFFLTGIPARDLTEAETALLTDQQYRDCTETVPVPLYAPGDAKEPVMKAAQPKGKDD